MSGLKQTTMYAFNAVTRRWVAAILRSPLKTPPPSPKQLGEGFALISWNIDAFSPRPIIRASCILNHILSQQRQPDVIFFQEVKHDVYDALLRDHRVREQFLATDAEDRTAFQNVPFLTVILLSTKMQPGFAARLEIPSQYGRDGLFIDIHAAGKEIRFMNVHLDSLSDTLHYRTQQLKILADHVKNRKTAQGIIAGDFNAIAPGDHELLDENGLEDQWTKLNGKDVEGPTWRDGHGQVGRLDKIATIGLVIDRMEILKPGRINVPLPGRDDEEVPWSDHCGLACSVAL